MFAHTNTTTNLGQIIAAEFDRAALYSSDPKEISRLATQGLARRLRGNPRVAVSMPAAIGYH